MEIVQKGLWMNAGAQIIETSDDVILNSQVYDKASYLPVPFNFYNVNLHANTNVISQMSSIVPHDYVSSHYGPDYRYIIQDCNDPNVTYAICRDVSEIGINYLCKLTKTKSGYDEQWVQVQIGTYWNRAKFLCQTNDYILIAGITMNTNTYERTVYITRVHKNTMTATYTTIQNNDSSYKEVYLLENNENDMYLLLLNCTSYSDMINVYRYNINTNAFSLAHSYNFISTNGGGWSQANIGVANPVYRNGSHYLLFTGYNHSNVNYVFYKITINNNIVNGAISKIANNTAWPLVYAGSTRGGTPGYSVKNLGNNHFAITLHRRENSPVDNFSNYYKHLIVWINDTGDSTVKSVISFSGLECRGVLYYDNNTVIFHMTDRVLFYKMNPNTYQYTKCHEISGAYHTVGIDEAKRIYLINWNNQIEIISNVTSVILHIGFASDNYNYTGTDLNATLNFYAKNFLGEYIETPVEINLTGCCEFTDGTTDVITKTSAAGSKSLSVSITGPGKINAVIQERSE